jgi:ribosomal protein S12 methylthiotransferase
MSLTLAEKPVRRVGMISLGCPKNLVDGEIMLGQLQQESEVVLTHDLEDADVVIVNTCGFIDAAKQESIDTILEVAERKGRGLERLIVTGCMVQKYRTDLQQAIPEIDAFVGLDHLEKITEAVTGLVDDDAAPARRKMSVRLYEDLPRVLVHGTSHAYLKVSEGCSNPCTFCAIPQMRGKFRSRGIDSLVREAQQLQTQGVKELCLVAQDTTRYGEDLGIPQGLTRLVKTLLAETDFRWIRFLYAYPGSLDWSLFELMGQEPRFVSYCDIPLQHVSQNVLSTMRRPGSRSQTRIRTIWSARSSRRRRAATPVREVRARKRSLFARLVQVKDFSQLLELPATERLQLVEALWDSLVEVPQTVPISKEVREELDRRLAAYYADPSSARPWAEIRAELFGTE